MIRLNGEPINVKKFPDGTVLMRVVTDAVQFFVDDDTIPAYNIEWLYDDEVELLHLMYLVKHIRDHSPVIVPITLCMPYIPNARMDRVKGDDEVFTLKWFTDVINSLEFDEVYVLDPHSNVSRGLLNRVRVIDPSEYIYRAIDDAEKQSGDEVLVCYPDEGASKRYSEIINKEYIFCIKHRDWRTGAITSLELTNQSAVGGTFTHTATALKKAGARNVYLYVTHCENTIEKGTVLTDGIIEKVFTTRSICRVDNEKIIYIDEEVE